jgi:hypothetical protein
VVLVGRFTVCLLSLASLVVSVTAEGRAAGPAPETLPSPRPVLVPSRILVAPEPVLASPPPYLRANRYDVWQYYGVDSHGRFQPLVVESPAGYVYRASGVPAPWVTVNPRSFQRTYIGQ